MDRILIVDDEPAMRRSLSIMLRHEDYAVDDAASGQAALEHLAREVADLVLVDLRMDGVDGMEVLRQVKQMHPDVEVIVMTAYGSIEAAVEAMRLGAFDFIEKPFEMEQVLLRVRNALERRRLKGEVSRLRAEASNEYSLDAIIGASAVMRRAVAMVPRAGQTESTVLITGEPGTGKELVARALHGASRRVGGQFVSVSCAALPDNLMESELFGHARGAFTSAASARKGLFEEAQGGTFFLDEIGEASLEIQKKLLRVLEERSMRRLGDNRPIALDIRIIAATNRDLSEAMAAKEFREDLYYRLNFIRIHLPPLRDRIDDVPLLARHFLARHSRQESKEFSGFTPAAMAALTGYKYPGNVRELSGIVAQAVALAPGPFIELSDIEGRLSSSTPPITVVASPSPQPVARPRRLVDIERDAILERITARNGDLHAVAQDLVISRTTLWRRMKEYQIEIRREGFAR